MTIKKKPEIDSKAACCLPNDKILVSSKLEGFADERLNKAENVKFAFESQKNIVGKE